MIDPQIPEPKSSQKPSPPEISSGGGGGYSHNHNYRNPPESVNPDAATLRDQWRFAIRQYGKWYSHAWGTAILAGVSFFALGWVIKGSNPLPSFDSGRNKKGDASSSTDGGDEDKTSAQLRQNHP